METCRIIEFFDLFQTYLETALLLAVGLGIFNLIEKTKLSRTSLLKLGYAILGVSLCLPAAVRFIPKEDLFRPKAQIWSGMKRKASEPYALIAGVELNEKTSTPQTAGGLVLSKKLVFTFIALFLFGFGALAIRMGMDFYKLRRFLNGEIRLKKIGRATLLASARIEVPFSAWIPGRSFVVIPIRYLSDREGLRIALKHEIQHHRQGDTRFIHALRLLKALFFWNPALFLWERAISHVQEFACDEFLIRDQKVSPHAYGRCLVQAAEWAVGSRTLLAGTTSMAASTSGRVLKRRVENMLNYKSQKLYGRWLPGGVALVAFSLMASVAFASRSAIQDRTFTMAEAQALLAKTVKGGETIPLTVNDLVLEKLNLFIGTPEGRKFVKEGLTRMPIYQPMIEKKIAEFDVPSELLAVALFESGFDNKAVSPYHAAGIWQFMAQTAVRYDLVVTSHRDDRFNPELETVAAMRYLRDLNQDFQDWRLALKAYNEGEGKVESLIEKYHTRDPWELERISSSEGYLSGAIAMIIILKNPSLLE
jgi:hypothetical protein